jgi:hypothetical protein
MGGYTSPSPSASPTQPLGFRHQCLAGLDHLFDPLGQCIAGSLLRLPVRPLVLVDLDALASCLGGAIRAEIWRDRTTILNLKEPM